MKCVKRVKSLKQRIDRMAYKSLTMSRDKGTITSEKRLNKNPVETLRDFLAEHPSLDPDNIFIQRAHRLGRLKPRRHGATGAVKHGPLIALFRDYPDVELILKAPRD